MHGDMHSSKSRNRAYLDGHKDVVPGLQDTHDAKPPLKFAFDLKQFPEDIMQWCG
jgi:hypothetical protein